MNIITFEHIKNDPSVQTYIKKADEALIALGYTEHSFAHVTRVSDTIKYILTTLNYPEREIEIAQIAGYLHDIGNTVNRVNHALSGAAMSFTLLNQMGGDPMEIASIITAIGNHDEHTAVVVNHLTAALILSDKTDVRRSRARKQDFTAFDIHDRVNYSAIKSAIEINQSHTEIVLNLTIDTQYCSVMDYFEIFLGRMLLCKKAAEKLGLVFMLVINNQHLM